MHFTLSKSYAFQNPYKVTMLLLVVGMSVVSQTNSHALEETSPTSTMKAEVVRRCYKCEGDCNMKTGMVEDCHPDTDAFKFACYKIVVDGQTFQRGCTRDFSEGEECVEVKGTKYCFCREDGCNGGTVQNISSIALIFGMCFSLILSKLNFQPET